MKIFGKFKIVFFSLYLIHLQGFAISIPRNEDQKKALIEKMKTDPINQVLVQEKIKQISDQVTALSQPYLTCAEFAFETGVEKHVWNYLLVKFFASSPLFNGLEVDFTTSDRYAVIAPFMWAFSNAMNIGQFAYQNFSNLIGSLKSLDKSPYKFEPLKINSELIHVDSIGLHSRLGINSFEIAKHLIAQEMQREKMTLEQFKTMVENQCLSDKLHNDPMALVYCNLAKSFLNAQDFRSFVKEASNELEKVKDQLNQWVLNLAGIKNDGSALSRAVTFVKNRFLGFDLKSCYEKNRNCNEDDVYLLLTFAFTGRFVGGDIHIQAVLAEKYTDLSISATGNRSILNAFADFPKEASVTEVLYYLIMKEIENMNPEEITQVSKSLSSYVHWIGKNLDFKTESKVESKANPQPVPLDPVP